MAEDITENVQQEVLSFIDKVEHFYEAHKQQVQIGAGVLAVLIVGGIYLFANFIPQRNLKAQKEMYMAEMYFAKDSFQLALNGNGVNKGFLDIGKKYGWTKAANLSNYYAGICYLNLKQFDKAVSCLKDFSTNDPILGSIKLSAIGDAYMEQNKTDDGISYYQKAAEYSDNKEFAPYLWLKTGMALESQKKYAEARIVYQKLKDKYPLTEEGRDAEKYLARVSAAI